MDGEDNRAPVDVDQIECAPLGRTKIAVRITGRWRNRRGLPDVRAFLVIEADGHRHRFPAMPEPRRPRIGRSGAWAGTFALPSSLEPHLAEAMSLWLGDVEVPLPSPPYVAGPPEVSADPPAAEIADEMAPPGEPAPDEQPARDEPDATIDATRAELQQRAAAEAQLRGALADTRAELEGRVAHQTALESTQAELRDQLVELLALVERESTQRSEVESRAVVLAGEVAELHDQLAQLRAVAEQEGAERVLLEGRTAELSEQLGALRTELAHSEVARDAALGEAAGLRQELERLGSELSQARAAVPVDDGLSEAQALLEEARAATARLLRTG